MGFPLPCFAFGYAGRTCKKARRSFSVAGLRECSCWSLPIEPKPSLRAPLKAGRSNPGFDVSGVPAFAGASSSGDPVEAKPRPGETRDPGNIKLDSRRSLSLPPRRRGREAAPDATWSRLLNYLYAGPSAAPGFGPGSNSRRFGSIVPPGTSFPGRVFSKYSSTSAAVWSTRP